MFQTKEWDKTSEEELSEVDIGIVPKKEFQSNDCKDDQRAQETNEWTKQAVINS